MASQYLTRPRRNASSPPLFVAIVGGSGSGKTWLAEKLEAALCPQAARFSLDDFYLDRSHLSRARRARLNFDHPRALDWPYLKKVLQTLRAGRPARLPVYNFSTHCRLARPRLLRPKPIILIDGLWLLRRPDLRRFFDLRILLDCAARIRLRRRLERDLSLRGRTRASVRAQFRATVEPMHARFVAPQRRWADVVLRSGFGASEIKALAARLREGS